MSLAADYAKAVAPMLRIKAETPPAPLTSVTDLVDYYARLFAGGLATLGLAEAPEGVETAVFEVPVAFTGATVALTRFATPAQLAATEAQPSVVYVHGGGMIVGSVAGRAKAIGAQVLRTGVQHWAVEYTTSPQAVAPASVEETLAAFQWMQTHAAEHGLDAARIGVMGESAGGGIAAGVGLLARDRRVGPPIAKLVLVYPMLDDRTSQTKAFGEARDYMPWTAETNAIGWAAYLGVSDARTDDAEACRAKLAALGDGDVSVYAAPARAPSLAGLPPTYLDVGTLDLFVDEVIQFAQRLVHAGVSVDLHVLSGVPHAFELVEDCAATRLARQQRTLALQSY